MGTLSLKVFIAILAAVSVALGGSAYFYHQQYVAIKQNPQKYNQETIKRLVDQVGKLMLLPAGESPTIATVVDVEKLKDQPFFAHARVGFKVLIYTTARKAILFDPVNNKIIEVAPLTIGNPPAAPEQAATEVAVSTTLKQ